LAERDNASVTSPAVLMVCFASFTGGNQIQWIDCGTNDPGQSSCTGQISECSPAAASEQGQRARRILSQYGNRSSSSAAQRLATLSSLSRLPKTQ
ncbi:hypothetical protein KUCAC02_024548, partial [Chaenocephalus aceratus]